MNVTGYTYEFKMEWRTYWRVNQKSLTVDWPLRVLLGASLGYNGQYLSGLHVNVLIRTESFCINTHKMSDNEEGQGPKSTFSTYIAEGDQLFQKREYVKAIESFSTVS